MKFNKTKR